MTKKNPANPSEQFDAVIAQMDVQISDSANTINCYDRANDLPKDFAKLDLPSDTLIASPHQQQPVKGEILPTIYPEMKPFNKEIPIDEAQLRKNVGLGKMGKIDDITKGGN